MVLNPICVYHVLSCVALLTLYYLTKHLPKCPRKFNFRVTYEIKKYFLFVIHGPRINLIRRVTYRDDYK